MYTCINVHCIEERFLYTWAEKHMLQIVLVVGAYVMKENKENIYTENGESHRQTAHFRNFLEKI